MVLLPVLLLFAVSAYVVLVLLLWLLLLLILNALHGRRLPHRDAHPLRDSPLLHFCRSIGRDALEVPSGTRHQMAYVRPGAT